MLAIAALLLRLTLLETPEFTRAERSPAPRSAIGAGMLIPALQVIGILALWSVSVFAAVIYMPTFTVQHGHISPGLALWATVIALIFMLLTIPVAGHCTDKFGVKPVILTASIGYLLVSYPGFALVANGASYPMIILIVAVFGILSGVISGAGPVAIGQLFAVHVRSTWTSVASAIGSTLFGGFATLLITTTGITAAPGYYVMGVAAITGLTALTLASGYGARRLVEQVAVG